VIFEVPVVRNSWQVKKITVDANSPEEAKEKAIEAAGDEVYDKEDGADYWADVPEKVE